MSKTKIEQQLEKLTKDYRVNLLKDVRAWQEKWVEQPLTQEETTNFINTFHTISGTAGSLGLLELSELAKNKEYFLEQHQSDMQAASEAVNDFFERCISLLVQESNNDKTLSREDSPKNAMALALLMY